jgi:P2 family phage contractile tail tube protein
LATVDLPSFEAMTETIAGAGIAGEYASPVLGHFASQMVKLAFRTTTKAQLDMLAPVYQRFDVRGSVQIQDPGLGLIGTHSIALDCRGQVKNLTLGKMEPGKVMGSELDLEIARITVDIAGVRVVELDKFNMVFAVNGVDFLANVRRDLGGL